MINIQDSTLAELEELTIDGVSHQVTTSGAQLFDYSLESLRATNVVGTWEDNRYTTNGIVFTINDDGTIVANGTATATASISLYGQSYNQIEIKDGYICLGYTTTAVILRAIHSGGGYTFLGENQSATVPTKLNLDTYSTGYIEIVVYSGSTISNVLLKPVFSLKSQTIFEPYTGGAASPSLDYPQAIDILDKSFEIGSCGKNLLDVSKVPTTTSRGITINYDEATRKIKFKGTATGDYSCSSQFYHFIPKGLYTFSCIGSNDVFIWLYDKDNALIANFNIGSNKTIITAKDATKIRVGIEGLINGQAYDLEVEYQLEKGSTATDYESYQGTTSTIALPDGEFAADGDLFRIVFSEKDGKYHLWLDKNVGRVILSGGENWQGLSSMTNSPDYLYAYTNVFDNQITNANSIGDKLQRQNDLVVGGIITQDVFSITEGSDRVRLAIKKSRLTSQNENGLQAFLEENPITIYAMLVKSYSLDLGYIDVPLTYYPMTNVFTTHDLQPLINIMYYRDIKNTITTMQADIEALKEAVATLIIGQENLVGEIALQEQVETEGEVVK